LLHALALRGVWQRALAIPGINPSSHRSWNREAVAEIVPEADRLFSAGLHQPEEGVAIVAAEIGTGIPAAAATREGDMISA
jgi:hypothetical protein